MRNFLFLALLTLVANTVATANDGVCHKCEMIREANKHKVNKYEYYEDYLKDQQENPQKADAAQPKPEAAPAPEPVKK